MKVELQPLPRSKLTATPPLPPPLPLPPPPPAFQAYAEHLEAASIGRSARSLVAVAAASLGSASRRSTVPGSGSSTTHTSGPDPLLGIKEVSISQLHRCSAREACNDLDWLVA